MNRNNNVEERDIDESNQNQNVIKGSQRSDGTYRKDIKIREGFINLLDAEKYKIPQRRGDIIGKQAEDEKPNRQNSGGQMNDGRKQNQTWRNSGNNYSGNGYQGSQNNANNEMKRDTNQGFQITRSNNNNNSNNTATRPAQDKQTYNKLNEGDFPDFVDNVSNNRNSSNNNQGIDIKTSDDKQQQDSKQVESVRQSDKEVKTKNGHIQSADTHQDWEKETDEAIKITTKDQNKQQFNSHISNIVSTNTVNKEKEVKKLSKKLREIEQLEQKQQNGLDLQPEAIEKMSKKDEIIKMLENLSLE